MRFILIEKIIHCTKLGLGVVQKLFDEQNEFLFIIPL